MSIDEAVAYFKENGAKCKKVEDDSPEYRDYIAIFSFGNMTRREMVEVIASNDLACIFFESAIREDEYRKKREALN